MDPVQQLQTSLQERIKKNVEEIENLELLEKALNELMSLILIKKSDLKRQQFDYEGIITKLIDELNDINNDELMNIMNVSDENVALNERRADIFAQLSGLQSEILHIRKKLLSDRIEFERKAVEIDIIQVSKSQLIADNESMKTELTHF
jgi:hypothetical protein